jgi:hypothetical protein
MEQRIITYKTTLFPITSKRFAQYKFEKDAQKMALDGWTVHSFQNVNSYIAGNAAVSKIVVIYQKESDK